MLGRLGGEEFAVLLPGVSRSEARAVAERLRRAVEQAPFAASAPQPPAGAGHGERGGTDAPDAPAAPLRATVSIGLVHSATLGSDADIDTLLLAADAALYRAKTSGRNSIAQG